MAYRFLTDFPDSLKVLNEEVIYCFPEDYNTLFPEERSMLSAQQPLFKPMKLSEIGTDRFCSTPILIKVDENARMFISESDLESYPGMFLRKQGKNELAGKFAAVSLEDYKTDDRQIVPTKRADYIARVNGTRNYPWRAMIVAENDANLINAIDFINETKQPEEENQKPQPTEITIIEKRSLRTKVLLICGIAILSTALIGTFIYIGMQLYNLFA